MTTILKGGKYDGWDNVNVPSSYLETEEGKAAFQAGAEAMEAHRANQRPDPLPECGDKDLQSEMITLQTKIAAGLSTAEERDLMKVFVADPAACAAQVKADREKAEKEAKEAKVAEEASKTAKKSEKPDKPKKSDTEPV